MGRKRKIMIIAVAAVFLLSGAASSLAFVSELSIMENTAFTGAVDIRLRTFTEKEGREIKFSGSNVLEHGQDIPYIPRLTNMGSDCYIRVAIFAGNKLSNKNIAGECYGISDEWKYAKGYLYYTRPFKTGETVDICRGFKFPGFWEHCRENVLKVTTNVDAVQKANFVPDFESDGPWGEIIITNSEINGEGLVNTAKPGKSNVEIINTDDSKNVFIEDDKFFDELFFMPGDVKRGTVKIVNKSSRRARIFFKAKCRTGALSDGLELEIDNGEKNNKRIFHRGLLSERELLEYRVIAEMDKRSSREIKFKISMPESAENSYMMLKQNIKWYFAADAYGSANEAEPKTGEISVFLIFSLVCFTISSICIYLTVGRKNESL